MLGYTSDVSDPRMSLKTNNFEGSLYTYRIFVTGRAVVFIGEGGFCNLIFKRFCSILLFFFFFFFFTARKRLKFEMHNFSRFDFAPRFG